MREVKRDHCRLKNLECPWGMLVVIVVALFIVVINHVSNNY